MHITGHGNNNYYKPPKPVNSMVGGLINSGIGLLENKYNSGLADTNVNNMQGMYNQQIAAARPGNVTGGVYGNTNYNTDTNTLDFQGNENYSGMLQGLYGQTNNYEAADPYQLAETLYDYNTPNREKFIANQQNELDERLRARGMINSSGGNAMVGELAQSQMMAMSDERMKNLLTGQDIANSENSRYQNAITALNNVNTGVMNQNTNAIGMGAEVAPPQGLTDAYTNQMATNQKTGSGIADILGVAGTALAGPIGGLFGNIAGQFFS